jgi:hypothetical protein
MPKGILVLLGISERMTVLPLVMTTALFARIGVSEALAVVNVNISEVIVCPVKPVAVT